MLCFLDCFDNDEVATALLFRARLPFAKHFDPPLERRRLRRTTPSSLSECDRLRNFIFVVFIRLGDDGVHLFAVELSCVFIRTHHVVCLRFVFCVLCCECERGLRSKYPEAITHVPTVTGIHATVGAFLHLVAKSDQICKRARK